MGKTYGGMWKPARQQAGKLKEETAKDAFKKGKGGMVKSGPRQEERRLTVRKI